MMDMQRMTFYLILSRVRNCLCMRSQPLEALPNQLTQCVPALGPANLSFPFSTVGEVSIGSMAFQLTFCFWSVDTM